MPVRESPSRPLQTSRRTPPAHKEPHQCLPPPILLVVCVSHSKVIIFAALRANISETSLVPLINEQKGEKEEIRDEREFSWCCSFLWGFGCRGTKRRLASWRAAAQWSGSQSGRRSGAGFAAGSPSSCQTEAADLHSRAQTTHLTRSRSRCNDARGPWRPSPPRRAVLVSAGLLAARAGPGNPRGSDPTETWAEVQAKSAGRRKPEAATTERTSHRRSA